MEIQNYEIRTNLYYHPKDHFWLDVGQESVKIGLDALIQETMGAFVGIQIKAVGSHLTKGESMGSLEAEKHVSHLKAPVSGIILGINPLIEKNPYLINTQPFDDGWILEIRPTNFLSEERELLKEESEILAWFESEIEKFKEKEWLAEP